MILNTTFHISGERRVAPFIAFMRDTCRPAIQADNSVRRFRFIRIVSDLEDSMYGYVMMLEFDGPLPLMAFKKGVWARTLELLYQRFGENALTFTTIMADDTALLLGGTDNC